MGNKIQRIYVGTEQVRPVTKITEAGIYWDSNSGLISFQTSNGVGITIADKNLGATEVNGQGNAYQWGNNYGWAYNVNPTNYTSTKVNASTYGPGNYYSSSTFIYTTGSNNASYYWDSSNSANLWGGTTGTYAAMQGPCPTGFHVPSRADFTTLVNAISGITGSVTGAKIIQYCKLPSAMGAISRANHTWTERSYTGILGSQNSANYNYRASFLYVTSSTYNVNEYVAKADGVQVRPFKNEFVQPDIRWTKLN